MTSSSGRGKMRSCGLLCALVAVCCAGCQSPPGPVTAEKGNAAPVNVRQMAPPPPADANPQQKAMMELAQQKAREAMARANAPASR